MNSTNKKELDMGQIILEQIVSGGQTGADRAGLFAGKVLGLKTGGMAPKGWKTTDGSAPWLEQEYGLVECTSVDGYVYRTQANVLFADGTVRFFTKERSAGKRCMLKTIKRYEKPYIDFNLMIHHLNLSLVLFRRWLVDHEIKILNVTGNSEQTSPGIGLKVAEFLFKALKQIRKK